MIRNSEIRGRFFIKNELLLPADDFNDQFLYEGINVYEVLRISDSTPLFSDDHCERFSTSLRGKGIDFSCTSFYFRQKIHQLAAANDLSRGNIKIVFHVSETGESFLILYPVEYYYPGKDEYKKGVSCAFLQEERPDPALKSWRAGFKERIRQLRDTLQVFEIILVTKEGIITEGTQSNIFFVEANRIVTAKLERVLAGITRKYVFNICISSGIEIIERDFTVRDIRGFDSAFLSGTSPKILPVRSIGDLRFNPHHPMLIKIMEEYNKVIEKYILENKKKHPF